MSFDIAALFFALAGIGLTALGAVLVLEPTHSIGVTIGTDRYPVTGFLPGVVLLALGILVSIAFIAAYRAGSRRLVRAASLGLLAAGAYGLVTTGQGSAFLGAAFLAAITWIPRNSRPPRDVA